MKFKAIAIALAAAGACTVTSASATQWYDFTMSGNDMMTVTGLQAYVGSDTYASPRALDAVDPDAGYLDGSRRFTPVAGSSLPDDMRTYRDFTSTMNFFNWYGTTDNRLAQFNLWGYGGADAYGWGEDFQAQAWGYNADSSSPAWDTYMTWDPAATGVVLNWWSTVGYAEGLSIGADHNPTFTFSLGLADDFDNWYRGQEGSLAFWFGGDMLDPNNRRTGTLQGNIVLSGSAHNAEPVPEPATMLLFGTGIAGLVGWRRRQRKHNQ